MNIAQKTTERAEQVEILEALIDQMADAFKKLEASTNNLQKTVYHIGRSPKSVHGTEIHGMSNLHSRVKSSIEWKLFGTGIGACINLSDVVGIENQTAVRLEEVFNV